MSISNKTKKIMAAILCGAVAVGAGAALVGCNNSNNQQNNESSEAAATTSVESSQPAPDEVVATASIMSTGDILLHSTFLGDGDNDGTCEDPNTSYYYNADTKLFDFNPIFKYVKDYYQKADYSVCNLEVTLSGEEVGYNGYPLFNSPDTILDALKDSGIDMVLTATNHVADTEAYGGFDRTQDAIGKAGLQIAGTQHKAGDQKYNIVTINGIKIGITNYVYTSYDESGKLCINGMPMSDDLAGRVNHFTYDHLDDLYKELEQVLADMKNAGAEAFVIYPHWGEEYQLTENQYQDEMAQKFADLGFDAVIGGHTHCVQPCKVFTSKNGKSVPVLFSMGNEVSNQRKELMDTLSDGHTEDSLLYYLYFEKYGNGTVKLVKTEAIPTWTHMYMSNDGKRAYEIVPLDKQTDITQFNVSDSDGSLSDAKASYERTWALVGQGVEDYNKLVKGEPVQLQSTAGASSTTSSEATASTGSVQTSSTESTFSSEPSSSTVDSSAASSETSSAQSGYGDISNEPSASSEQASSQQ